MKNKLLISESRFKEINNFFTKDSNPITDSLVKICKKYGGVEEIKNYTKNYLRIL